MWIMYNPNPTGSKVGDCTVRAISKALGISWNDAFCKLMQVAYELGDMPSANRTWGTLLQRNGFERRLTETDCRECYTVRDFCRENPKGTFVLAISGHVVCVKDGDYHDTWDSGNEVPLYYWRRRE